MSVKAVLDTFGASLVKQSRANLTRKKKKASGSLYKSLDYEVKESKNSFQFSFLMEDHGDFIDKGVKGVGGTKADGTNWKKKKVTNNKYSYRNPSRTNSNGRFKQSLGGWTIRKGIAPRNKKGQFTTRKSLIFAIRKSIFHTGIETTNFYSKPFELAFKKLPDDVVEAYGLELDKFLEASIK
mgnify:CR=1 FL=1|tara:strand:- start:229 stop:774 length:546 start_codon:yes stop_codon:yes gene_type:complete